MMLIKLYNEGINELMELWDLTLWMFKSQDSWSHPMLMQQCNGKMQNSAFKEMRLWVYITPEIFRKEQQMKFIYIFSHISLPESYCISGKWSKSNITILVYVTEPILVFCFWKSALCKHPYYPTDAQANPIFNTVTYHASIDYITWSGNENKETS